jgi:TatD DNase family protein
MLIDAHAHLTHISFQEDIHPVLKRASQTGIEAIINICTHPDEVKRGLALSKEFPWIYNVAATTPHDVEKEGEECFSKMEYYARRGALVAVGETGLDYHYYPGSKEVQQHFLRRYLHLAKECGLPVVIHCREAFTDLFQIIDEEYSGGPGVLHCFTGTPEEAEQVIKRGWYLSLSGIVTFKKSQALHAIAKTVPLERLLIETDAPYLAPTPYRGKRNEPAYLVETAKCVASLRGIPLSALAEATAAGTRTLFRL